MKPKLIVLINPILLHENFCRVLREANIQLMAFYTFIPASKYIVLDRSYFVQVENLTQNLDSDLELIRKLIKDYDLISVIPAYEIDYGYSEKVAYALWPEKANDPQTSELRYKKYEMNQALKAAGLNAIPQICLPINAKNLDEIKGLEFPVIVKPSSESAGSIGVKSCQNFEEAKEHIEALNRGFDFPGKKSVSEIVIQERIEGTEYFVDSVTQNGKHYIIAIFKYEKVNMGGLPIYRYIEFVNPEEVIWQICYDYALKVLDTLKMRYGFAHTEFMVTSDNQPYLMEINPRLSGLAGEINRLAKIICGYDQSDVYLNLIQQTQLFENLENRYKQQKKLGRIVFLFAWREMTFNGFSNRILEKLQSQEVVYRVFKSEGSLMTSPKSLVDVIMTVTLIDENINHIIADTNYLQELEEEGKLFNE